MYDQLDGRDETVRKHYKNRKDMIAEMHKADDVLAKYTSNPWEPAFYSRFDDFEPVRVAHFESYVEGIVGARYWELPVTEVEHHDNASSWYDQMEVGTVCLREIPNGDGTSEFVICLK